MAKDDIAYTDHFEAVARVLTERGLLLVATDGDGRPNAMTIGWGSVGSIWGMPIWTVLVRPSRYTYGLIEQTGEFTVNVPGADLAQACAVCGSRSGRDMDKFVECGLTAERGRDIATAVIAECPISYECVVVHKHDLAPTALAPAIASSAYQSGDYHRVYYGRIVAAYADTKAAAQL